MKFSNLFIIFLANQLPSLAVGAKTVVNTITTTLTSTSTRTDVKVVTSTSTSVLLLSTTKTIYRTVTTVIVTKTLTSTVEVTKTKSFCTASTTLSPSCTATTSPVLNGDFETGNLEPWTSFVDSARLNTGNVSISSPGYESDYAVHFTGQSVDQYAVYEYLSQDFCSSPGLIYDVSFMYRQDVATNGTASLDMYISGSATPISNTGVNFNNGSQQDSLGNMPGLWNALGNNSFQSTGTSISFGVAIGCYSESTCGVAVDNIKVALRGSP